MTHYLPEDVCPPGGGASVRTKKEAQMRGEMEGWLAGENGRNGRAVVATECTGRVMVAVMAVRANVAMGEPWNREFMVHTSEMVRERKKCRARVRGNTLI